MLPLLFQKSEPVTYINLNLEYRENEFSERERSILKRIAEYIVCGCYSIELLTCILFTHTNHN